MVSPASQAPARQIGHAAAEGETWRRHWPAVARVVAAGLLLEGALVVGFLLPFNLAAHPEVIRSYQPPALILGPDASGAWRMTATTVAIFAAYALGFWWLRPLPPRLGAPLALGFTALFAATLLWMHPVGSQDVFHNIASARTYWLRGENPTRLPPSAFPDDPIAPRVFAWQTYPSTYGPLWYQLSGLPLPFTGDGLVANVLGQKALATAFFFGVVGLTMLVAERFQPGMAAPAGLLVGWNPLLQYETAGNAHNDVVMIAFTMAAIHAIQRRWWLAVFPLLALAVAVKHVFILLAPLVALWMFRQPAMPPGRVVLSGALGALVGLQFYAPFMAGGDAFSSLSAEGDRVISSTGSVISGSLERLARLPPPEARAAMRYLVLPVFLAGYLMVLWRLLWPARVEQLTRLCFWTLFLFLVVAKWWFWPWYLLWLVPLAAVMPRSRPSLVAGVFSFSAMLSYVPVFWPVSDDWLTQQITAAGTALVAPVLVAALAYGWPALAARGRSAGALNPDDREGRR